MIIKVSDCVLRLKDGVWLCDESPGLGELVNAYEERFEEFEAEVHDPNPEETAAKYVIERLGEGEIVETPSPD